MEYDSAVKQWKSTLDTAGIAPALNIQDPKSDDSWEGVDTTTEDEQFSTG